MTITVLAGTPVADIRRLVAERGQRLPGMPEDAGTIGGLVAAGWTAPEAREAHGTLRERLLGVQVADPAGRLTRSGGRVVKNVTGYDLHRMHAGAGGAFGVLTELTFRLEPEPEHRAEVKLAVADAQAAQEAWRWLRRDGPEVAFLVVRRTGSGLAITAHVEGDAEPAREAHERLESGWKRFGAIGAREDEPESAPPAPRLAVALRTAPAHSLLLFDQITGVRPVCNPNSGEIRLFVTGSAEERTQRMRGFVQSAKGGGPAYRIDEESPASLPPDLPRWSADPEALRMLARVKRALDPTGTLSPGSYSAEALERAAQSFARP
jgi:glycolate oxidase FAD binding subunit